MKKIFFLLSMFIFTLSCHTPLSCVEKHPENYQNRNIKVHGYAQDWLYDYHGYYFIVLSNRYCTHHLVIYKQMPNINYKQHIKASGYLIKTQTPNSQTVFVLVDTNNFTYTLRGDKGREVHQLQFRDTLPTLLWFQQQR